MTFQSASGTNSTGLSSGVSCLAPSPLSSTCFGPVVVISPRWVRVIRSMGPDSSHEKKIRKMETSHSLSSCQPGLEFDGWIQKKPSGALGN